MSKLTDKKMAKLRDQLGAADDATLKFFADPDTCFIARTLLSERGVELPKPKQSTPKHPSKSDQWSKASAAALQALQDMEDLRSGWGDTYENMPENLQSSAYGEKLSAMNDLDLESCIDTVQEAADLEVPLGFGRD